VATGGNSQIGLTWTAVAGATSYNIKRSTTSGSGYLTIATVTVTNYTDLAVTVGATYYYVVSALIGTSQSANSNEASATPLSPPTGVSATPGDRAITLAWAAMSGATSYNVKRATVSGGPYTTIASVTGTTFTDTGLAAGVTYYYVVSAMMGVVESVNSSEVSTAPSLGVEDDDKCGLLGIEILGLLGLLRLFRRR
jgi:cellulose 1,4-beta-cellobiosidase